MDPTVLIAMGLTAANGLVQVLSQAQTVATPTQAHTDLIAAHANLLQAIANLLKATPPAPPKAS